jgi:GTPase SAR1 family protein
LLSKGIKLKSLHEVVGDIKINKNPVGTTQENKTLIGYKSGKIPVYTDDKAKHIFICGTTGSGKTVALSNYIKTAVDKDYPLLLIDGKGDINDNSMLDIVTKLKQDRKLYVVNMVDPVNSDKYNPFSGANPTTCKDMLINMSEWSEEHYKANTERYLERLIRLLNLAEIPLTFKNIIAYMPSKELQVLSAKLNKEGLINKDEHMSNLELIKTSGVIANSACARFSLIAESEIGNIFNISKESGIDIYQALSEKAIILFILNPLSYPELSPLLGRLILIDSKKAVSKMSMPHRF